jgi:hypothetical protein
MQVADVWNTVHNDLAIQFQQQTEYPMGAGVLGTHIQQHRVTFNGAVGNQMTDFVECDFLELCHANLVLRGV